MGPRLGSHASSEKCSRQGRRRHLKVAAYAAVILALLLVGSIASLALAASPSFPDVPASHPYYGAITDLASRNIIGGYTDGRFGPGDPVTRQQFAKMIVGTGGYEVTEADVCPFTDVQKSDTTSFYPDNFVAVCAAHGITTGKTATTFDPYSNITRYQVVTMVVRAADDLKSGLLSAPSADYTPTGSWGADPTHGANAKKAEYNGLLAGLDLATLSPTDTMSRGEVAQVLHNLLVKLADGSPVEYEVVDPLPASQGLAANPSAVVLDVREPSEWAETGIVSGSVLIPLAQVEARAADELSVSEPVYVMCRRGVRARTAAETLLGLGFTKVVVVEGGLEAWLAAGLPVVPYTVTPVGYEVVDPLTASQGLAANPWAMILDVRQPVEWAQTGRVSNSVLIPLAEVEARALDELRVDYPVYVICEKGVRARTAAETLVGLGFTTVIVVEGGIVAWLEAGLPTVPYTGPVEVDPDAPCG